MNSIDLEETGKNLSDRYDKPTLLFSDGPHSIYWLGWPDDTAFRCNAYLIVNNDEALVVDPGGSASFGFITKRVSQITPVPNVTGLIFSHPGPDAAASLPAWISLKPNLKIISSFKNNLFLSFYGEANYEFVNTNESQEFKFASGYKLKFVDASFLHHPGAIAVYDEASGFLFSGDIWSAIDMDWKLVVSDFRLHELKLNLFHLEYMTSHIATQGFVNLVSLLKINAILPQHGSVIPKKFVIKAIHYLGSLRCGLDLVYPDLK